MEVMHERVAGLDIGKATLTEFANFLTNGMPTGYSSLGGYGFIEGAPTGQVSESAFANVNVTVTPTCGSLLNDVFEKRKTTGPAGIVFISSANA